MKDSDTYKKGDSNPEHLDEMELARYVEYLRKETESVPERLQLHVEACAHCRSEVMAIADMLDILPEPAEGAENAGAGQRLAGGFTSGTRWIFRTAAAVAAVLAITWGIRQLLPDQRETGPVAVGTLTDSLPARDSTGNVPVTARTDSKSMAPEGAVSDTVRYAEAYVPNPTYENLVHARYRSGTDPNVTGPGPASVFHKGDTLKLAWTPDPNEEYDVVVLDNRERRVAGFKAGSAGHVEWKITPGPGLYYWKFLSREDMWKVGRFRVITDNGGSRQ